MSLSLLFDPDNINCYIRSGTTYKNIYHLSGIQGKMTDITYVSSTGCGSFLFNGTSSTISFHPHDFGSTFTIIVWVYPQDTNNLSTIMSTDAIHLYVPLSTTLSWQQLAYIFDGSTLISYKNGIIQSSTSIGNMKQSSWWLGSTEGIRNFFKGFIGTFKAYTLSLNTSEILKDFNQTKLRYGTK